MKFKTTVDNIVDMRSNLTEEEKDKELTATVEFELHLEAREWGLKSLFTTVNNIEINDQDGETIKVAENIVEEMMSVDSGEALMCDSVSIYDDHVEVGFSVRV